MKKFALLTIVCLVSFVLYADQIIPEGNKGPAYLYPDNPADRLYRLPFAKGKTFPITDGYWSDPNRVNHEDYSLDWTIPEGEPLLCARAGRVRAIRYTDSVCVIKGSEGNYVVIGHVDSIPDSTRPTGYRKLWIKDWYQHIHHNIPVKLNDMVEQGQIIGYCSCTGKSEEGPHLHFEVNMDGHEGTGLDGRTITSIPIPFVEVDRHNGFPEVGETYYSQNEYNTSVHQALHRKASPAAMPEIIIHPNPFNPVTKIAVSSWRLAVSHVKLKIFDIKGIMIKKLIANSQQLTAGITWNASGLPSGTYLIQITLNSRKITKKALLLK